MAAAVYQWRKEMKHITRAVEEILNPNPLFKQHNRETVTATTFGSAES